MKEKIEKIFNHFGLNSQIAKTIEEMAELMVELLEYMKKPTENQSNFVIEELADCFIMLEQMKDFFGAENVEKKIEMKIDRTISRIDAGYYERQIPEWVDSMEAE